MCVLFDVKLVKMLQVYCSILSLTSCSAMNRCSVNRSRMLRLLLSDLLLFSFFLEQKQIHKMLARIYLIQSQGVKRSLNTNLTKE